MHETRPWFSKRFDQLQWLARNDSCGEVCSVQHEGKSDSLKNWRTNPTLVIPETEKNEMSACFCLACAQFKPPPQQSANSTLFFTSLEGEAFQVNFYNFIQSTNNLFWNFHTFQRRLYFEKGLIVVFFCLMHLVKWLPGCDMSSIFWISVFSLDVFFITCDESKRENCDKIIGSRQKIKSNVYVLL